MTFDNTKPIKTVNHNGVDVPIDLLNIAYGTTPPSDVTRLWVPLDHNPANVEVNGEYMNFGQNVLETWKDGDPTIDPYTKLDVDFAETVGNIIYVFERNTKMILEYSPANGTFTECCSYSDAGYIRAYASCKRGTDIFVTGGSSETKLFRFDTVSKTFEYWMAVPSVSFASYIEYDGFVYHIIGNPSANAANGTIYKIDVDNKVYSTIGSLPTHVARPYAWKYNGKIWVLIEQSGSYTLQLYSVDPVSESVDKVKEQKITTSAFYTDFGLDCTFSLDRSNALNGSALPVVGNKVYLYPKATTNDAKWNSLPFIFDMETLAFTKGNSVVDVGFFGRQLSGFVLYDMGIYLIGGKLLTKTSTSYSTSEDCNKINVYRIETFLENNHLKIFTDMFGKQTALVNSKYGKLYATVREAFVGNEDGYARPIDAYIYNRKTSLWETVDGVSVTQDMLNALAELGVT